MKVDRFYKTYVYNPGSTTNDKVSDPFHESINILPFTANLSISNFDSSCGIRGITGEFYRKNSNEAIQPIYNYEVDVEECVTEFLFQQRMKQEQIDIFKLVMKDLMCLDGKFVPFESSFLKYVPLDYIYKKNKVSISKYGDGQSKLADYLYSMLDDKFDLSISHTGNLFSETIQEALSNKIQGQKDKRVNNYFILPFIKRQFLSDLKWISQKEDYVILKYIDLMLYFYCCYSITQSILRLDSNNKLESDLYNPEELYYILDFESASDRRDVVKKGWAHKIPDDYLMKLYGRMQTIDMLNVLLTDDGDTPIGIYPDILKKLKETPFDDKIKQECEEILMYCRNGKYNALKARSSGNSKKVDSIDVVNDLTVSSYEEFIHKLESICKGYQSFEYQGRMWARVMNLLKIRFLQTRSGRGNTVLVLDSEMLVFLIAMITKEEKCKLKDMYKMFRSYGINFDLNTRTAIENILLKLNILERRSDSGEAQYVNIVL